MEVGRELPVSFQWRWRGLAGAMLVWLPAVLVLLPVAVVAWRIAQPAGEMWAHVVEHRLAGYLGASAGLAFGATLLALIFGISTAWFVSVYDFRGRKVLEWLLLLPLAMPAYVAALAYLEVLQSLVPFYVWVRDKHGLEAFRAAQQAAPWVFSIGVLGATLYPYVYLVCRIAFGRRSAALVDAARTLGASSTRIFWKISLPLALPPAAAGGVLVALEVLNDVGVVSLFGLPTLTPGIFRVWGEGHIGVAMRLAGVLTLFVLLLGGVRRWLHGRRGYADAVSGGSAAISRRALGIGSTLVAWTVCGVPLVLGLVLPGLRLGQWAVLSWDVIEWDTFSRAALHSLTIAALAVAAIVVATLVAVGGGRALPGRSSEWARQVTLLGYAAPAAMIAVGVGFLVSEAATRFPFASGLALSSSIAGLTIAGFVRFLSVSVQPASAGMERVAREFHQAARTLRAGPLRALWQIDFPLVRAAIVCGATLAFVDMWKELSMTMVLRPFNYETLPTLIFRLADQARIPEASVPALCLVAGSLAGLIPMNYLLRRSLR